MTQIELMAIARDLFITACYLAGPAILVSMFVGTAVSIFQTITSIQEQTLTFAPRIVAVMAVILVMLPWSLQVLIEFTTRMMLLAAEAAA
jgi:flagellar biosynthetic protein FliQ